MDLKEEILCRLCLEFVEEDGELIDDVTKEMLDELLLAVDITVSKDPVLCANCMHIVRRSYRFKDSLLKCLEMPVVPFSGENPIKYEENTIKVEEDLDIVVHETVYLCQFCREVKETNCVSSDILFEDPKFSELMATLVPEKRFGFTKNSIICIPCKDDLEEYLKFAQNCLETENKIRAYCQEFDATDTVKLTDIRTYVQDSDTFDRKNLLESPTNITSESLTSFKEEIKEETLENDEAYDIEHIELDNNKNNIHKDKLTSNLQCTICLDRFKTKRTLKKHKLQIHNLAPPETSRTKYQTCEICGYVGRQGKQEYQMHSLTHYYTFDGVTLKCANCTFETRLKADLFRHLLTHKDILNVRIHKCTHCPFESFHSNTLRCHMNTHKSKDEVKVFKCEFCPYESIHRHYLTKHKYSHKVLIRKESYKCNVCEYATRTKISLDNHMLSHTFVDGTYNCDKCPYKTMLKSYYDSHVWTHLDSSEIEMHKCPICPFETKYKRCLVAHKTSHAKSSEKVTFKCSICSCETLRKSTLKRHIKMVHADISEVETYRCANCTFETRYKCYLRIHVLSHMNPSETEVFKCHMCSYETVKKCNLKQHLVTHKTKKPSKNARKVSVKKEIWFECANCSYRTERKGYLRKHIKNLHQVRQR